MMKRKRRSRWRRSSTWLARFNSLCRRPRSISPTIWKVALSVPSRYAAAIFYDVIPLKDGRIAFALGDVSGKGIAAALLAAMAQGALQSQFAGNLPLTDNISSLKSNGSALGIEQIHHPLLRRARPRRPFHLHQRRP
ncbi:MAG: SpoIIE family protein phosphatase [Acidobacteria bacterium]|nr:SpoIIE family protein phosphatase [Acidobacteriota bacterium]